MKRDNVRKISNLVFQVAEPPSDGSRPLEWRRDFNVITFEIGNISTSDIFQVNALDIFSSLSSPFRRGPNKKDIDEDLPFRGIKAEPSHKKKITGTVYECRDTILYTEEDGGEQDVFALERPSNPIRIALHDSGEYIRKDETFPNGVYEGQLIYFDDPDEDCFYLDAQISTDIFDGIVRALKEHKSPKIILQIALLSYSYEVDDALREHWMPRDIFIQKHIALSPVLNLEVSSDNCTITDEDEEDGEKNVETNLGLMDQEISKSNLDRAYLCIGKLSHPLWIITILLLLMLMK